MPTPKTATLQHCGMHIPHVSDQDAALMYSMQQQRLVVDIIEECEELPGTYVIGIGPNVVISKVEKRFLNFKKHVSDYLEGQLLTVAPFPIDEDLNGQLRMKLSSAVGTTKWLNLTITQFAKIQQVLLDQLDTF